MLETRSLTKTYKPKKGVPVTAIDNVSVKFSDTGMIFILGKSGSGKSTLLNLLGGLDSYDKGEVIINGVSSRKFKSEHFDSYRNTYIGFIFQEYNILEEFTVGANVALAIELQGKKASDNEINRILSEVDLDGYGMRKPGELSGGQKQRVAIARALVKNPDIILADEPTGALDSATGKQVLETLKKLSKKKLVIVVSHDREFAEKYADRIIELADGKIISDKEYFENETNIENVGLSFEEKSILVPSGYRLVEDDLKAINEYLDTVRNGRNVEIFSSASKRTSAPFDEKHLKYDSKKPFHLIRSKLPLKSAFRIGAGALKYKKIRLVITVLLSCIAFGLFGLADTFGSYDHIETCTESIIDSEIDYASVTKSEKVTVGDRSYFQNYGFDISNEDIEIIKAETGVDMIGVFRPKNISMSFEENYDVSTELSETYYNIFASSFSGFGEIDSVLLEEINADLIAGCLPDGSKNEIMISSYLADTFIKAGYRASSEEEYETVTSASQMVGKKLRLGNTDFTVCGIVDTHFDIERYEILSKEDPDLSTAEQLVRYALSNELSYVQNYSLNCVAMVGNGFIDNNFPDVGVKEISEGFLYFLNSEDGAIEIDPYYMAPFGEANEKDIVWFEEGKSTLEDREIVISKDMFRYLSSFEEVISESSDDPYFEEAYYDSFSEIPYDILKETAEKTGEITMSAVKGSYSGENEEIPGYRIVGYVDPSVNTDYSNTVIATENECDGFINENNGRYEFAVGAMPDSKEDIKEFLSFAYDEKGDVKYPVKNSVTYELDSVNTVLVSLSEVFLYTGIAFAVFAAIMLSNFIATSISYKKQEIGILRAIGSRSNDVFRIFFSESFIIATINFILSSVGVFVATTLINDTLRNGVGLLITVLSFGIRQVVLLFLISIGVAALASYIPVKRIASKRPIDAIRNR